MIFIDPSLRGYRRIEIQRLSDLPIRGEIRAPDGSIEFDFYHAEYSPISR